MSYRSHREQTLASVPQVACSSLVVNTFLAFVQLKKNNYRFLLSSPGVYPMFFLLFLVSVFLPSFVLFYAYPLKVNVSLIFYEYVYCTGY